MLTALCQHLNGNVIGDHTVVDKSAQKFILRFARCGKAYLDLLKSDIEQYLVVLELFLKAHRNYKALVAVTHIHAAPYGRLFYMVFFDPFVIFF